MISCIFNAKCLFIFLLHLIAKYVINNETDNFNKTINRYWPFLFEYFPMNKYVHSYHRSYRHEPLLQVGPAVPFILYSFFPPLYISTRTFLVLLNHDRVKVGGCQVVRTMIIVVFSPGSLFPRCV